MEKVLGQKALGLYAVAFLFSFAGGVILHGAYPQFGDWLFTLSSSEAAAWVQAIGSVFALFVAVGIADRQRMEAAADREEAKHLSVREKRTARQKEQEMALIDAYQKARVVENIARELPGRFDATRILFINAPANWQLLIRQEQIWIEDVLARFRDIERTTGSLDLVGVIAKLRSGLMMQHAFTLTHDGSGDSASALMSYKRVDFIEDITEAALLRQKCEEALNTAQD